MNYAKFYKSTKKILVDSLLSLWFKGRPEEQEYIRFLLNEEEPLIAEPVFQSIFPWEESKESFEEHCSKLKILSPTLVKALSSESVFEDLRFPLNRHPYKHQTNSWKSMLSTKGKTIVVTSGTGSGKTECFMIPVIQDILNRNEKNAIQAIFLYPLNALMNSQQKRIHAWCDAMPEKITYAIYNGDTEKEKKSKSITDQYYPRLITRPQIRETPPQILFTNPTMLNYMLVRSEDKSILEKSKGKLRWILLDEAHTYTGSSAAELALQIRRVLEAFEVSIDDVNFAVTSATIGDEKDPQTTYKLKKFVSQLTGKTIESIEIVGGKRVIPEIAQDVANKALTEINNRFQINISYDDIIKLRKKLNSKPVLYTSEIAKFLNLSPKQDIETSLEVINLLGEKINNLNLLDGSSTALLPTRIHFFVRSLNGIYACVNNSCKRHKTERINIGNLTSYQNLNCQSCGSKMLELATCPSCGGTLIVGESSTAKGFRMQTNVVDLETSMFYETIEDDLIQLEEETNNSDRRLESDGFTKFYFAKPKDKCFRKKTTETSHVFNHKNNKIEIASDITDSNEIFKSLKHSDHNTFLCPHCGNELSHVNYLRASAMQLGRVLTTTLLDEAEGSNKNDLDLLYGGKKYITFTDNRQGSARSAMAINQDVERSWIRSSIFHKLADLRIDDSQSNGLSAAEEEQYIGLSEMEKNNTLPPFLKSRLEELKERKNNSNTIPSVKEVGWDQISQTLENNSDFRKLYEHLNNAMGRRYDGKKNSYLKALLVDQFGWIPKRSNSLETMGIVKLVYPELKKAKCPPILSRKGCKDEDWQHFLKIAIDYTIRGGRHYMLSSEFEEYLTQNKFTSPIYPSLSEYKKKNKSVSKWPVLQIVNTKVSDKQSRLVLLLCAVLGYYTVEEFDQDKIAQINSLLKDAWDFITQNILTITDVDNKGYMLDLLGEKVKIQLYDTAYLCPVDKVLVDTTFCGYSPRITGYIGKQNFEKYKVTQIFNIPYFNFKSDKLKEIDISEWIENNFKDQIEAGIFSNLKAGIYINKPIYISAEHSAQQSREDLEQYEKDFNNGHLNILSCSTTMEMGVDIGGISEVVMNNVPPKSANYLQRAGRAGRRSESKALSLTFCAPTPIGIHTWTNPDYPITHVTETPLLKLESRQLIQRHINALIFAHFVGVQGGMNITSKIENFFDCNNGTSTYHSFLNYIDNIISNQDLQLIVPYNNIVKGTVLETINLSESAFSTKKNISYINNSYNITIESFNTSIKQLENNDGNTLAIKAINRQKDNFNKTSLLTYLAENSFIPSAGIPTGLVECILNDKNENFPTLHLSQAISSYAPGTQVVKNEWIYEPSGIRLKTKYDDNTSRYIIQNCSNCGYTRISYGKAINNCPKCQKENSMHGIKDINLSLDQRFTEVVEPVAFTVSKDNKPSRKINTKRGMNLIQPILLEMDPWENKNTSTKITLRCSNPNSEILFYNKGNYGYGYIFCPYCGRMESEKKQDDSTNGLIRHKHLLSDMKCPGGESQGTNLRRHVILVGRYQTDFVEIRFYDESNSLVTDSEMLYSLGIILSRKLTEFLGINDGEIDFGYNNNSHSIFIYDVALGGAGYSLLFREYKDQILNLAYEALNTCNCERSCTKCLIDRQSQWYINYINRHKALEWLECERKARIAPKEITNLISDASFVTSDFATELYQLSRNKDIKSLYVFINNDFENWNYNDFPYNKIFQELKINGLDACFVLNGKIDLSKLSCSVKTVVLSIIFQHDVCYTFDNLKDNLLPLLSVEFNDGIKKLYFGNNISRTLSSKWGEGDIFVSHSNFNFTYQRIDINDYINSLQNQNEIMFDTRLVDDCQLDGVFDLLTSEKSNKWNQIQTSLSHSSVSISYSDRYLHSPLGCMILANLIKSIKDSFFIEIKEINISVTKISESINSQTPYIYIDNNFDTNSNRNNFLLNAIENLTGIRPNINDNGYIEHERCLSINNGDIELCIRPDGGIAHGWKPFGRENSSLTDLDFIDDWTLNFSLFNQKKSYSGILFTVSFSSSLN